jgi:integrase/recombinase XerD
MSALAPTMQAFFTERLIGQRQASPHTIAAYRDTSACCSRSLSNAPASGRTASTSRISTPCWSPRFWITSSSSATAATPQDTERPAGGDPLALPLCRAAPPRARGHDRARARDPDQAPRPRDCQLPRRVGNRGAARCPRPSPLDRPARPRPDGPHHPDRAAGLRADHAALPRRAPRRRPPTSRPPARAASNASRRWPRTEVLRPWTHDRAGAPDQPLFPTTHGRALSRDGIALVVSRHATTASRSCPTLATKTVTPHVLRHTAAMHLLHAGVDTNRHRAAVRVVRPHARRRPDIRDHLVRRHHRPPPVRTAADAAVGKAATCSRLSLGNALRTVASPGHVRRAAAPSVRPGIRTAAAPLGQETRRSPRSGPPRSRAG